MAEHCGYITRLKDFQHVEGTNNLNTAKCFETQVIVSNDYHDGMLVVFFESGLQLSQEFCDANNLCRKNDANGKNIGGYLDPKRRNVRSVTLRGIASDGLALPLQSLEKFCDISELKEFDKIDILNGKLICCKYVPDVTGKAPRDGKSWQRREKKEEHAYYFAQHVDTEILERNFHNIQCGDIIEVTLKLHGSSLRVARTLYDAPDTRTRFQKFIDRFSPRKTNERGKYQYGFANGSRRMVVPVEGNGWRQVIAQKILPRLEKGEELFAEAVGFEGHNGSPIMHNGDNKKMNDPNFLKQYGSTTVFSYGCNQDGEIMDPDNPCTDVYVYRMTMTNEDGFTVEYSPDQMRERCAKMGLKTVPVFGKFIVPTMDEESKAKYILSRIEPYYDGPDPIGKTHVREGVVLRVINRPTFTAFKHKNHSFKVLSGIIVEDAEKSGTIDESIVEEM